jgi:hypothetical protein
LFVAWLNRFPSEEKLLTSLKLGIIIPAPLSINANHQTAGTCTITLVLDRLACYVTENNSFLTRERQRNHRFVETKIREQNLARSVKHLQILAFLASLILACCEKCCCKMQMFSGYQFLRMYVCVCVCVCVCVFMNARGERANWTGISVQGQRDRDLRWKTSSGGCCNNRRTATAAKTTYSLHTVFLPKPRSALFWNRFSSCLIQIADAKKFVQNTDDPVFFEFHS